MLEMYGPPVKSLCSHTWEKKVCYCF